MYIQVHTKSLQNLHERCKSAAIKFDPVFCAISDRLKQTKVKRFWGLYTSTQYDVGGYTEQAWAKGFIDKLEYDFLVSWFLLKDLRWRLFQGVKRIGSFAQEKSDKCLIEVWEARLMEELEETLDNLHLDGNTLLSKFGL